MSRKRILGVLAGAVLAQGAVQAHELALAHRAQDPNLEWGPCPEFMPEGCAIAVLQGNPAEPNADVFFRVPAKAVIPVHWHTSAERMVLVSGELQVRYTGQEPVVLTPGSYAYGPPKAPHGATCGDAGPCVLFIAFNDPVDAVPGAPPSGSSPSGSAPPE